ncbi:13766_t:CDS:2 [Gigaspora rosea]|nr:13766_t:CDS:2 [Gigaspora rosea]
MEDKETLWENIRTSTSNDYTQVNLTIDLTSPINTFSFLSFRPAISNVKSSITPDTMAQARENGDARHN